jgi:PAS domain S-box-containing protein
MWTALRNAVSRGVEAALRWLTASAIRSTAIFVILTFVPILLLTYYIVATSIRSTAADEIRADLQVRDFAASLLQAKFQSEREALTGAADFTSLKRALTLAAAPPPRYKWSQAQLQKRQQAAAAAAAASLARLHQRRPEFLNLRLYAPSGALLAAVPPTTAAALPLPLPAWFAQAQAEKPAISPLRRAATSRPPRLEVAAPVDFPVPAHSIQPPGDGVLAAALPTSVVAGWVRNINLGPDRFLYLLDAGGHVVTGPADGPFTPAQVAALPAATAALAGHTGSGAVEAALWTLESPAVAYAPIASTGMAIVLVRPLRVGFYIFRVFYDKLAFIAVIIFLLAVATGLLLRSAFRYYQRYNREVESGRAKTEALLGSIGDGVFAVDAEGRIIEFNPAAAALTGESEGAALGRPYAEVIALLEERPGLPPERSDPVRQAMAQGRTLRVLRSLTLLRPDGSRLPVAVTAAPVRDEGGGVQGCIVVFSDASQEREVDRMKNEFISIASHQLRTPMSGVKGVLGLLLENVLGPLSPDQEKYLRRAYEANERLIALVNDLLNISRLEQGSLLLRVEPVDLAAMLAALVSEFQPRAARYRLEVRIESGGGEGGAGVRGDPMRLREVFANLLDNAIKYTPEGGAIVVRWSGAPHSVSVEISDSGVGIAPERIPELFAKFSRIPNPLSGREFGTGLGLYFARSVVELHHGKIDVASMPGAGTTFRVSLPREPPTAAPGAEPVAAAVPLAG